MKSRLGDTWTHMSRRQQEKAIEAEEPAVQSDINKMWQKLAEISDKTPEEIEEIRQAICQRIEIRKKYVWYHNYSHAVKSDGQDADESTIERILSGDTSTGPQIDKFSITVSEENEPHVILNAVNLDVQNELGRYIDRYPGLVLRPGLHRYYPFEDVACHLLGYIGKVNQADLKGQSLSTDAAQEISAARRHWANRVGTALRAGGYAACVGPVTTTYGEEASSQTDPPIPGQTVRTSIDIELQQEIQGFFSSATLHDSKGVVFERARRVAQQQYRAARCEDKSSVGGWFRIPPYDLNHLDEDVPGSQ